MKDGGDENMSYSTKFRTLRLRRGDLQKLKDDGKTREIEVVGLVYADDDVTPDLIEDTISKTRIYGRIIAMPDVKKALLSKDVA